MNEIIKRREICKIVHTHADHFEPYRNDGSGQMIGAKHVEAWVKKIRRRPHGLAATPFFSSHAHYVIPNSEVENRIAKGQLVEHEGDLVAFCHSSRVDEEKRILECFREHTVDMEIHIHHEHWTSGPTTGIPCDQEGDGKRLDFYLKLLLEHYRKAGFDFSIKPWAFVHGCWALNASDRTICNITNEIEILMKHGCRADFSFPAGRPWCDPKVKEPFTILPTNAERCYDHADMSSAILADSFSPDRFLIWSSQVPSEKLSLDLPLKHGPDRVLRTWLQDGYISPKGTLFIKTHCHSLNHAYWPSWEDESTPLLNPDIIDMFEQLDRVANQEGVDVWHVTVSEMINLLKGDAL